MRRDNVSLTGCFPFSFPFVTFFATGPLKRGMRLWRLKGNKARYLKLKFVDRERRS